jgi:CHAT domain-containing protein/tetratricopeptide (TPR) repeat protein
MVSTSVVVAVVLVAAVPLESMAAPRQILPDAAVASTVDQVPPAATSSQGMRDALRDGFRLIDRGELPAAQSLFDRALSEAIAAKSAAVEADARRGLGTIASRTNRAEIAQAELERALAVYETLSDRNGIALTARELGNVFYTRGERERARGLYLRAIADFRAADNLAEENKVLYKLAYSAGSSEEAVRLIERGLAVSRALGDKNSEGVYHLIWGNRLSAAGDYAAAMQRLQQAIECIEAYGATRPEASPNFALALTSLGRLYSSHGEVERGIAIYRRALAIHEQSNAPHRTLPILNAIAQGHQSLKEYATALQLHRQILERARASGAKAWVGLAIGRLGGSYVDLGDYARAVDLLQEAIPQNDAGAQAVLYHQLSAAYSGLGRDEAALVAAEKSVELASSLTDWETRFDAVHRRARARQKAGLTADALADARAALLAIEQVRARLVPADFLKRGFGDQRQAASTLAIDLLTELGRYQEAFEAAEQGRARAFLDLLATRELDVPPASVGSLTALRQVERRLTSSADASSIRPLGLATRGTDSTPARDFDVWRSADSDLRSLVSVEPISFADSVAVARRLGSTVVSYWVAERETFVWVVKPDAVSTFERIPVTSAELNRLVRRTWAGPDGPQARTGTAIADTTANRAMGNLDAPVWADLLAPRYRGTALVAMETQSREAWRALYSLLIRPIRSALPRTSGSLLTIIPHGPLLGLSFAALIGDRSRYLVEDYTVHYAPAVGLFPFTERRKRATRQEPSSYLLVANPEDMPAIAPNKALPPLLGSAREVAAIARLFPPDRVTVLTGKRAREETVRSTIANKAVVHLATHGILRDDDPLESFLALGGLGTTGASDGRLTAAEIYALSLQADLVVLSACRSGLGRVSGDGMMGLTRALFYAGAPTVVATLWDVADEPAVHLMPRFYQLMDRFRLRSRALRHAQLQMLGDLRAGRIQVTTPAGRLPLPEHPAFWASFVLQGEP